MALAERSIERRPEAQSPATGPGLLRNVACGVLRHALLALSRRDQVRAMAMRLAPARQLAARFVAGETRADAVAAVRALRADGLTSTIDVLGENVTDPRQAEANAEEYIRFLEEAAAAGLESHVSIKLTAMGVDVDERLALDLVGRIAARAPFVRLDMEGSAYTASTLRLFRRLRVDQENVGVVLQAYLHRTAADVEEMIQLGARVRLCKGAYDEPASIAFPNKSDVDANYLRLAERLLAAGTYPALATHDERIIRHVTALGVPREDFEFQMLFGVRRDLQQQLAREGYNVRVYVPYGRSWYPYFMRRLAERPANLAFLLRSMRAESPGAR
jgi:proline dehydrogenase